MAPQNTDNLWLGNLIQAIHDGNAAQGGIPPGTHRLTVHFPSSTRQWVLHVEPAGDERDAWADPIETSDRPFDADSLDIQMDLATISFGPLMVAKD
jgi:hypothetical protein